MLCTLPWENNCLGDEYRANLRVFVYACKMTIILFKNFMHCSDRAISINGDFLFFKYLNILYCWTVHEKLYTVICFLIRWSWKYYEILKKKRVVFLFIGKKINWNLKKWIHYKYSVLFILTIEWCIETAWKKWVPSSYEKYF